MYICIDGFQIAYMYRLQMAFRWLINGLEVIKHLLARMGKLGKSWNQRRFMAGKIIELYSWGILQETMDRWNNPKSSQW